MKKIFHHTRVTLMKKIDELFFVPPNMTWFDVIIYQLFRWRMNRVFTKTPIYAKALAINMLQWYKEQPVNYPTVEVLINAFPGGFDLGKGAVEILGLEYDEVWGCLKHDDIEKLPGGSFVSNELRTDKRLIELFKQADTKEKVNFAFGKICRPKIIRVPADASWKVITNENGTEYLMETGLGTTVWYHATNANKEDITSAFTI